MPPYPLDGPSILDVQRRATKPARRPSDGPRRAPPALAGSPAPILRRCALLVDGLPRGVEGPPAVRRFPDGGARSEALGSNNWVVDGSRTASGKPLLANDPHLGAHVPSLWYLAHMKAGDFEVIGATLPGAPAVAIGRNRHIAWGETNMAADVQDLYRERLDASGTHAEFKAHRSR